MHILCPEGALFIRFGCPKVPLERHLGTLGDHFAHIAHILAAHVLHICFYGRPGWDLGAKWLESDTFAPCFVCYNHGKN